MFFSFYWKVGYKKWLILTLFNNLIYYYNILAGQMVVTDQTNSEQRAVALSHCGVSYSIGMVVGPMLGGMVTSYSGLVEILCFF